MSSLDLSTTQLFLQSKKVAGDHSSKSSMGRDSIISKWGLIWITPQIKREMKRRTAVESIIDHLKAKHHMGRNHLAHSGGDAINAVLAVGSSFRLLLKWLRLLLLKILIAVCAEKRGHIGDEVHRAGRVI